MEKRPLSCMASANKTNQNSKEPILGVNLQLPSMAFKKRRIPLETGEEQKQQRVEEPMELDVAIDANVMNGVRVQQQEKENDSAKGQSEGLGNETSVIMPKPIAKEELVSDLEEAEKLPSPMLPSASTAKKTDVFHQDEIKVEKDAIEALSSTSSELSGNHPTGSSARRRKKNTDGGKFRAFKASTRPPPGRSISCSEPLMQRSRTVLEQNRTAKTQRSANEKEHEISRIKSVKPILTVIVSSDDEEDEKMPSPFQSKKVDVFPVPIKLEKDISNDLTTTCSRPPPVASSTAVEQNRSTNDAKANDKKASSSEQPISEVIEISDEEDDEPNKAECMFIPVAIKLEKNASETSFTSSSEESSSSSSSDSSSSSACIVQPEPEQPVPKVHAVEQQSQPAASQKSLEQRVNHLEEALKSVRQEKDMLIDSFAKMFADMDSTITSWKSSVGPSSAAGSSTASDPSSSSCDRSPPSKVSRDRPRPAPYAVRLKLPDSTKTACKSSVGPSLVAGPSTTAGPSHALPKLHRDKPRPAPYADGQKPFTAPHPIDFSKLRRELGKDYRRVAAPGIPEISAERLLAEERAVLSLTGFFRALLQNVYGLHGTHGLSIFMLGKRTTRIMKPRIRMLFYRAGAVFANRRDNSVTCLQKLHLKLRTAIATNNSHSYATTMSNQAVEEEEDEESEDDN